MKQLLIISAFILFVSSCATEQGKEATATDINTIMDQWHKDAANAQLEDYIDAMAQNGHYIGTDATEDWSRDAFKEFCAPYFEQKKTWNFKPLQRKVYFNQDKSIAWFNELLSTHMGICIGSGVLSLDKSWDWKIEQYVLSIKIPNEHIDETVQIKSLFDQAFIDSAQSN